MSKDLIESTGPFGTNPDSDLQHALKHLEHKTILLRSTSLYIGVFTFLNLVFSFAAIFMRFVPHHSPLLNAMILSADLFLLSAIMWLLLRFDNLHKDGESIYQEISDELEWHIKDSRNGITRTSVPFKETPGFAVRLAMRGFVQASRLPFFRGEMGVPFFLSLNIAIALFNFTFVAAFLSP